MHPKISQFMYHGSPNSNIEPGTILRPGSTELDDDHDEAVSHATTDYATASTAAGGLHQLAPNITRKYGKRGEARGAIYFVEPVDEAEMHETTSKLHSGVPGHRSSTKGFRVIGPVTPPKDVPEYPRYIG